ncbi:eukaryotic translation initiation factor 4E-binding protein 1-like [Brachionichthys hirsutus]|uniref:eukaryotic translation initiation factor 4E-binding protein 1-like n=1 Tax=Brachionichthys hirsutus TaxID=412623 RepID=UPI003604E46F
MSAGGQNTESRAIPAVRRVTIHDSAHMPQDYSTTPGGTLFSTTPGGTRIIYDRKFLLQCRTSPLARTPPELPDIPGVTSPLKPNCSRKTSPPEQKHSTELHAEENAEDDQFEMDI